MKCEICGYVAKRKCDFTRHIRRCKLNKCLHCGKDTLNPKYCNKTCAALATTKGRKHKEETKIKIAKSVKETIKDYDPKIFTVKNILTIHRRCKQCGILTKNKHFCSHKCWKKSERERTKDDEWNRYRLDSMFTFNIYEYPDKFNLELIEKYGWYNAIENPSGVARDHILSVYDGFYQRIPPQMIKHPANCNIMIQLDNMRKHTKSDLTIEELETRIINW